LGAGTLVRDAATVKLAQPDTEAEAAAAAAAAATAAVVSHGPLNQD